MGRQSSGVVRLKMIKFKCMCIARASSPFVPAVFSAKSPSSSSASSIKYGNIEEFSSISNKVNDTDDNDESSMKDDNNNNKIMVVVNSSIEAKGALDWALSHSVQAHDTLILLHVAKPSNIQDAESTTGKLNLKTHQLLLDMKNLCETKRPGVEVKVVKVEGEEKGRAIVAEAKQRKVSLLIIGQRKRSIMWCIMRRWGRKRRSNTTSGVAEYCIQNASCMTIAVRRKNKKLGGYLITTKRHKNFWLLA